MSINDHIPPNPHPVRPPWIPKYKSSIKPPYIPPPKQLSQPKRFRCLTTEEQREFNNKVIMPGLVMCDDGNIVSWSDYAALAAENERLTAEVEWLRKADRLVCWNPTTQQWEVRHEALK